MNEGPAASSELAVRSSLLHPLIYPSFALIAGATLVSSVGVWMRDTTSAWTVASSAGGAASVALVQAATALPTFFLALPAGVLADHFDRRRLLILCQLALAAAGAALATLSAMHLLTVGAIVGIAFVAGCAAALAAPAFQSIVPSLVPREEVRSAVTLSSVSFNIARVIGPGIGGILFAMWGAAATYACNAIAYLVTIAALLTLPRDVCPNRARAPIDFRSELHQGFAFVGESSAFRRLLARSALLYFCAACYLALIPAIAHDVLGRSAGIYSILLSAIGVGSLLGAVALSQLQRRRIADENVLAASTMASAIALGLLSAAREPVLACGALALVGGSTLIQLATFNSSAQLTLPMAIRGRGLSIFMAATFGAMAVGSLLWGAMAEALGIAAALVAGAVCFGAAAVIGRQFPISATARPDEAAATG